MLLPEINGLLGFYLSKESDLLVAPVARETRIFLLPILYLWRVFTALIASCKFSI